MTAAKPAQHRRIGNALRVGAQAGVTLRSTPPRALLDDAV